MQIFQDPRSSDQIYLWERQNKKRKADLLPVSETFLALDIIHCPPGVVLISVECDGRNISLPADASLNSSLNIALFHLVPDTAEKLVRKQKSILVTVRLEKDKDDEDIKSHNHFYVD